MELKRGKYLRHSGAGRVVRVERAIRERFGRSGISIDRIARIELGPVDHADLDAERNQQCVFADDARTESDANLLAGFQAAQAAGLSVVFKASLSALNGTPVSSLAPADVGSFFASYTAEIVHLATIAQAGGVETFAIGNEMSSLSGQQYRGYWTDLIAAVREVYHGELTYAAATDEASRVSFWDQLDVIGVNTYPPLTSSTTPTVQDLVNAWSEVPFDPYYAAAFDNKSPVDFLHSLSEQYGRPVLMTEMGYRSVDGTAIRPGGWTTAGTPDLGEQADAYKAFFQVWTAHGGSWLKGVELWQWDLDNQYSSTGYSVMGKPAAEWSRNISTATDIRPDLLFLDRLATTTSISAGAMTSSTVGSAMTSFSVAPAMMSLPAALHRHAVGDDDDYPDRIRHSGRRRRRASADSGQRPAGVRSVRVQAGG